jgi:hypothetical protein
MIGFVLSQVRESGPGAPGQEIARQQKQQSHGGWPGSH